MAGRILIGAAALALVACAKKVEGDPLYAAADCRRATIVDSETGASVIGAEDFAYDASARRVIISAYDRRRVEKEARKRAYDISQGGVYALSMKDIKSGASVFSLPSIVSRDSVAGGLRPHGIAFDATRREITFINRSYQKINGKWRMTPRIERASADGAVFVGDGDRPRCSANDVALLGDRTFVSFDHEFCGWRKGVEDIAGLAGSGVELAGSGAVFNSARHANGLAATQERGLALAATREAAIYVLAEKSDGLKVENKVKVPGAPDNLTVSSDGSLVAALYPSLAAIGAQRKLGFGRSASRIVRIDPETGAMTLLFEDPKAKLFSAASVAIEEEGVLILGSALDRGVLICRRKADGS
ncbi:MAG: hypothetical protein KDD85_05960 [Parvularculaceae bacterium]|nr:hypothetical protein [Parvularculaceae bacterium]